MVFIGEYYTKYDFVILCTDFVIMKKTIFYIGLLLVTGWNFCHAQVNISVVGGGGISDLQNSFPLSDNSGLPDYFIPASLAQLGLSTSSSFRKNSMLSWEVQLTVRRSSLRNLILDSIEYVTTDVIGSDGQVIQAATDIIYHRNTEFSWKYWSINLPVTLNFQVFGPVGWKIGGTVNYQISDFPDEDISKISDGDPNRDTQFRKFNWQGNLGVFAVLGSRLRLDLLAYSDLLPRLTYGEYLPTGEPVHPEHREMGLYISVLYRLK